MKDLPAWQENALWTEYASLRGRRRTDVVIVGGGFTGLTLVADLAAHGVKTALTAQLPRSRIKQAFLP